MGTAGGEHGLAGDGAVIPESAKITVLVERHYGIRSAPIEPLHRHVVAGRGIYRVVQEHDRSWVLRMASDSDAQARFRGIAAILAALARSGYPAPRAVPTTSGALVGVDQPWITSITTFVEGEVADFSAPSLTSLGAALGKLHLVGALPGASTPIAAPNSQWHPGGVLPQLVDRLTAIAEQIPPALQAFYDTSVTVLRRVGHTADLPMAIVHGDCWPPNAVRTIGGDMVMIDWEGAGLGPAVLDAGYLLLTCHLGEPQLPRMAPDPRRIAAVADGYRRERHLTTRELATLPDAVRFGTAFFASRQLPVALRGAWRDDITLQKLQARYRVSDAIADFARTRFEQESPS